MRCNMVGCPREASSPPARDKPVTYPLSLFCTTCIALICDGVQIGEPDTLIAKSVQSLLPDHRDEVIHLLAPLRSNGGM